MNEARFRSQRRRLVVAGLSLFGCLLVQAEQAHSPLVRIAEIEIDPAQLDKYKAAVTEEIETSIRNEPGVLAIYSVALKEDRSQLRFFEIYADEEAYKRHLESPHFKKYVAATKLMIKSRKLIETIPVVLGAKQR